MYINQELERLMIEILALVSTFKRKTGDSIMLSPFSSTSSISTTNAVERYCQGSTTVPLKPSTA